jgi:thioredoxin
MQEVTKESFEDVVIQSKNPIVIDFWGPQCGPCLALTPKVEQLEEEYKNRIKITKVEAPKNRRLCLSLKVTSLPTFLFYKDGEEMARLAGNVSIEGIRRAIEGMF